MPRIFGYYIHRQPTVGSIPLKDLEYISKFHQQIDYRRVSYQQRLTRYNIVAITTIGILGIQTQQQIDKHGPFSAVLVKNVMSPGVYPHPVNPSTNREYELRTRYKNPPFYPIPTSLQKHDRCAKDSNRLSLCPYRHKPFLS